MLPPETAEHLNVIGHDAVTPARLGAHTLSDDMLVKIATAAATVGGEPLLMGVIPAAPSDITVATMTDSARYRQLDASLVNLVHNLGGPGSVACVVVLGTP